MRVIGPEWESVTALRATLATHPSQNVLSWGYEAQGAINGMPRVDGLDQLRRFAEAGLSCPSFTTDVNEALEWERAGISTFGRHLIHTQGHDIIGVGARGPYHPLIGWLNSAFWVQIIPNVISEHRVHIFRGLSIAKGTKVQTGPTNRVQPVRSRANGWTLNHELPLPKGVRTVAKRALESVGYDFGAVDILYCGPNRIFPLEVNKAPSLRSPYTLDAYVKAIKGMIE